MNIQIVTATVENTNVVNMPVSQPPSAFNTTFPDLFAFGEEQERERLLKEQNKLIEQLLTKVSTMEAQQSEILQENDDLKGMIRDIHASLMKR